MPHLGPKTRTKLVDNWLPICYLSVTNARCKREWLSGRASPCQGESRGFDPRLPLHSCPSVTRLQCSCAATSPSGKARLCKSCTSGSNPLVASQSDVISFVDHVFFIDSSIRP